MLIKYRYYLISLMAMIPLCVAFYLFSQATQLKQLNQRLAFLESTNQHLRLKQKTWQAQLQKYQQADPFFLQNTLEKLEFLKTEKTELEKLAKHPAFKNSPEIQKLLKQSFQPLKFKQRSLKKEKQIAESEEICQNIELNQQDLMQLLSLIEEMPIGAYQPASNNPQLIIQKLTLAKTDFAFKLDLNLYKREFFHE